MKQRGDTNKLTHQLLFSEEHMKLFGHQESEPPSGARLSSCGTYRYELWRRWSADAAAPVFVMLNPSTADATEDDPTIRRIRSFVGGWRYSGFRVVNLFAYRATDPNDLRASLERGDDAVGPENDETIVAACRAAPFVVVAWGRLGELAGRNAAVLSMLKRAGVSDVRCLGVNGDGSPRHPLYLPKTTKLVSFGGQ